MGQGITDSRIRRVDRDRYFDRSWTTVTLALQDGPEITVNVKPSFWKDCSELLGKEIGRWLQRHELAPWPTGHPPKVEMEPISEGRFAV